MSLHKTGTICILSLTGLLGVSSFQPDASIRTTLETLQDSERDRRQQPERVMDAVGLRVGMAVGEVGAGEGYFTFWLSKRVGEGGKVYANDIDPRALKSIEERCRAEGVGNIETVLGRADDPQFPSRELDMTWMVYVLHQISRDRPQEFLVRLKSYLKPNGTVVVIEMDPQAATRLKLLPVNRIPMLLPKEETVERFEAAGYELIRHETFLERDYVSVFRMRLDGPRTPAFHHSELELGRRLSEALASPNRSNLR